MNKQTSVKKSFELPLQIKLTVKILENTIPYLAKKFALKLFFTPLKFSIPKRELEIRSKAKTYKLTTAKQKFTALVWEGSGPNVLLCHGWSGRSSQFMYLIPELQKLNYNIVSFDAPGHGANEHQKTNLYQFIECINLCEEKFGSFEAAIGHSLGGQAILSALVEKRPQIPLVTIGTPASIRNTVVGFCNALTAGHKVKEGIIENIQARYKVDIDKISAKALCKTHNPKGLIIHDTTDTDVPVENAYEMSDNWLNAKLIITEGHGHRRVLKEENVIKEILTFLDSNLD